MTPPITHQPARFSTIRSKFLAAVLYLLAAAGAFALIVLIRTVGEDAESRPSIHDLRRNLSPSRRETSNHVSDGWSTELYRPMVDASDLVVAVRNVAPFSTVALLDGEKAELVGRIDASDKPFVAVRRAARPELLVSDVYLLDGERSHARLLVFELTEELSLRGAISLPERISYITSANGMRLSADARYLYYVGVRQLSTPECRPDADTSRCDSFSVGIVDLESLTVIGKAPLSIGCGAPVLAQSSLRAGIGAMCSATGQLFEVAPDASVTDHGTFGVGRYSRPGALGLVAYGGLTSTGEPFQVLDDGSVRVGDQSERLASLGVREHFSNLMAWPQADGSIVLGIMEETTPSMTGALVWKPDEPAHSVRLDFPVPVTGAYPFGSGRLALITEGRYFVLDVAAGEASERALLPPQYELAK